MQVTEKRQKKTRAPKATNVQLEYLISYMENHTAFATGKLLGARGKPFHDNQWQHLSEQLNSLDGPSKGVEGWKKLWCDQRNQARNRAAKAKTAQKMTGNIGTTIQLKDFDLRILSIFGGESSVGLPIMEVGLGDRPEDVIDPLSALGLTSNNIAEQDINIEKENNISIENGIKINEENIILFPMNEEDCLMQNLNEQTNLSNNFNNDPIQLIDEPCTSQEKNYRQQVHQVQPNVTKNVRETPQRKPKKLSKNISSAIKDNRKRPRSSSLESTQDYIKETQDKQIKILQAIVAVLNRIASATEQQNELFKKLIASCEETLNVENT